jgi:hypothetical protein
MSTENPTLSDFATADGPSHEPPAWLDIQPDGPCCGGCGTPLTRFASPQRVRDIIRVVGTEGSVPACPGCVESRPGASVETITMAVNFARKRRE